MKAQLTVVAAPGDYLGLMKAPWEIVSKVGASAMTLAFMSSSFFLSLATMSGCRREISVF